MIEIEDLYFSYQQRPILEGVNLKVRERDFLAIIGPNGGGKTTLLRLILGLLTPQKGKIRVFGEEPSKVSHRIGYLPQELDFNLSFPITVLELAKMGCLGKGKKVKRSEGMDPVRHALEMVGMWEKRYEPIGRLSGGQRQRAFIARALASMPEILLLDEPTANVDPEFQTDLYHILKAINKDITVIVITHDVGVISSYVKSVACVNKRLVLHEEGLITEEMLKMAYPCPIDLVAHGIPHRVFHRH